MAENTDVNVKRTGQAAGAAVRMALRLIAILLIVFIFHFVISAGYDFGYNLFAAPAMSAAPGREVAFTVEPGESTAEIIDALADAGLIRDKFSFRCQIIFYDKILQPGEYTMNTSMTSKEILLYLNDGPGSLQE
ncbi:MAG: endolytic transglycosylase MltG [Lachnospiraceae bacterium]|nr:endolytic transglycosylase MltG [Lachnospiraceae bacterium]